VEASDPGIIGIAALVLLTVALLAGIAPASIAARIQPQDALRSE